MSQNTAHDEVKSIQHYVTTFVSDLRQVFSGYSRFLDQYNFNLYGNRHFVELLSFFDLQILTTPLVSSNYSWYFEHNDISIIHHTVCYRFLTSIINNVSNTDYKIAQYNQIFPPTTFSTHISLEENQTYILDGLLMI